MKIQLLMLKKQYFNPLNIMKIELLMLKTIL